jgi:hypothetical protein
METIIELRTQVWAYYRSQTLGGYPCRLRRINKEPWIFEIGQPFPKEPTQWSWKWYLKTLLDPVLGDRDKLYLDYSQGWRVTGLSAALSEALTYVKI